ncbi:hypothetical protein MNBD_ALPHA11-311 [hydrothermal vent metagenome]|uniref:Uncharacterized protein n=1 Tax=hydrothermal vent metagenome TaxID=652676 RepID=A0A3B0UIF7_9ZZZZ
MRKIYFPVLFNKLNQLNFIGANFNLCPPACLLSCLIKCLC